MPAAYLKQYVSLKIKMSNYAKVNFFQYSDMGGNEPSGIFCSCFNFISKDSVLERIKEIITTNKYSFTVSEDGLVNTNHFIIRF